MMAHTLDIVVPFYNLGGYFKNSLTSLRQQTSTDFAVWLVDDGSTDESLALAKQAAAADDRFHVLTLPRHEGTSAARNAGVDAGTAPLVTFVDADDQVDPRFAATLIAGFQEYQADIVAVGYTWGGGGEFLVQPRCAVYQDQSAGLDDSFPDVGNEPARG